MSEIDSCAMSSKKRKKTGRVQDVMKKLRLTTNETGLDCKCKRLKCFQEVSENERVVIIRNFNGMNSKDEQDSYLCSLISVNSIAKRRNRKVEEEAMFHESSYSYKIRLVRDDTAIEIPVCYKAFLSLQDYKKLLGRLANLQRT